MQDLLARARSQLRHEPIERRVRASLGAETVVDSTRAMLVWEPRRVVPSYAVPVEDIRAELSDAPAANGGETEDWKPAEIDDTLGVLTAESGRSAAW